MIKDNIAKIRQNQIKLEFSRVFPELNEFLVKRVTINEHVIWSTYIRFVYYTCLQRS